MQSGSEEELRNMFGQFGNISRFRIHSHATRSWLPHYAFVTYDNIDAVRRCLAKRNSLYFPENDPNRLKLNVNGDESIVVPEDVSVVNPEKPNENNMPSKRRRDLKQFHKNFVLSSMTKDDPPTTNDRKFDMKTKKIESQHALKSDTLGNDRIHDARNQVRRISGKA